MESFSVCVFFFLNISVLNAAESEQPSSAQGGISLGALKDRISEHELGKTEQLAAPIAEDTTYLRVTGSALKPRNSGVSYTIGSKSGCVYVTAGSTTTVWNTPIYLPQGSLVEKFRLYYNDSSSSANMSSWITVYHLYGRVSDEYQVSSASDSGEGYRTSEEINHTINYQYYSYVLNWRPNDTGNDMQLCGFRIYYVPPASPGSTMMFPTGNPAN